MADTGKVQRNSNTELPMLPDDYMALDNQKAKIEFKHAADAKIRRVQISTDGKSLGELLKSKESVNAFDLELPEGVNIGLPGLKAQRMRVDDVKKAIDPSVDLGASRPEWVDFMP